MELMRQRSAGKSPESCSLYTRFDISSENEQAVSRILGMAAVPASVRFVSCEPLIGPLDALPLDCIHWVIVGGESGPSARPMLHTWAKSILHQCRAANVPFFFKQWGGVRKDLTGRTLLGRTYNEICLLYTSPSPRDGLLSRMPSS